MRKDKATRRNAFNPGVWCLAALALASLALAPLGGAATPERYADCRTGYGGAQVGLSGPMEKLYLERPASCVARVGGYASSTHYARLRWTNVNIGLGDEFWLYGTFSLPSDFYSRQESYLRLAWLENYNLDPWNTRRLQLVIYGGDRLPRIIRTRSRREETTLWKGAAPLPAGRSLGIVLHVKLSQTDGQALTEIYVDGAMVGSTTVANVTAGDTGSARFTRVGFGIDGAAAQDSRSLELRMSRLGITARKMV